MNNYFEEKKPAKVLRTLGRYAAGKLRLRVSPFPTVAFLRSGKKGKENKSVNQNIPQAKKGKEAEETESGAQTPASPAILHLFIFIISTV